MDNPKGFRTQVKSKGIGYTCSQDTLVPGVSRTSDDMGLGDLVPDRTSSLSMCKGEVSFPSPVVTRYTPLDVV